VLLNDVCCFQVVRPRDHDFRVEDHKLCSSPKLIARASERGIRVRGSSSPKVVAKLSSSVSRFPPFTCTLSVYTFRRSRVQRAVHVAEVAASRPKLHRNNAEGFARFGAIGADFGGLARSTADLRDRLGCFKGSAGLRWQGLFRSRRLRCLHLTSEGPIQVCTALLVQVSFAGAVARIFPAARFVCALSENPLSSHAVTCAAGRDTVRSYPAI